MRLSNICRTAPSLASDPGLRQSFRRFAAGADLVSLSRGAYLRSTRRERKSAPLVAFLRRGTAAAAQSLSAAHLRSQRPSPSPLSSVRLRLAALRIGCCCSRVVARCARSGCPGQIRGCSRGQVPAGSCCSGEPLRSRLSLFCCIAKKLPRREIGGACFRRSPMHHKICCFLCSIRANE